MNTPLILYVPGLLPKPEASVHRQALRRCLLEGLRRHDAAIAEEIAANERSFDLVAWTYDFYREHRDFDLDAKSIEALLSHPEASDRDIAEASSLSLASGWLSSASIDFASRSKSRCSR